MLQTAIHPIIISIHALRKESDFVCTVGGISLIISIHALRKESDLVGGWRHPM